MQDISKMRKYYFAVIWEVAQAHHINKEEIHEMLKVWYKIQSTTKLSYDEWYEYIENVLYFMACVLDMYFDVERFHTDSISYTWLYWTMRIQYPQYTRPDNLYLLFTTEDELI